MDNKQAATTAHKQDELKIEVIQLNEQHTGYFEGLVKIFQEVFCVENMSTSRQHCHQLLQDTNFIVLVATESGKVIGGLTAYVLGSYYSVQPAVYLYDIAVLPERQRLGVGKHLITALYQLCNDKGYKEIFVQAEADDAAAINFYRSTPISGELNATHFIYQINNSSYLG